MSLRFASLGSGSRGNGAVIACGRTHVLLDCGFTLQETERRLERLGLVPSDISAILVTHEHRDHIDGVGRFARKHGTPVWLTHGTRAAWREAEEVATVHEVNAHQPFAVDDLHIEPFPVPHDAREPCQYVFGNGALRLGVLSDVGSVTLHMRNMLSDCDALMIEANHDEQLLAEGPYPPTLKRRVGGDYGHLSNRQAADLLRTIHSSRIRHLVLGHLSEVNNRPDLARAAVVEALQCPSDWPLVADQDLGFGWLSLT